MKTILFAFYMLIFTCVSAQEAKPLQILQTGEKSTSFSKEYFSVKTLFDFQQASQTRLLPANKVSSMPSLDYLPSLFCKLEYQLESKSKLAPRFRLGSLQYTNWMEGKADFYTRHYQ